MPKKIVLEIQMSDLPMTRVWITPAAYKTLTKFEKTENPRWKFEKQIRRYIERGFRFFEGGKGYPIKHEWDQVYRIGNGAKFRLYGFYENGSSANFITLDAFEKNGQKLNAAERARIDAVRDIRDSGEWERGPDDEAILRPA